jgi:hypothetical protein
MIRRPGKFSGWKQERINPQTTSLYLKYGDSITKPFGAYKIIEAVIRLKKIVGGT